jgi:hypothetical protein
VATPSRVSTIPMLSSIHPSDLETELTFPSPSARIQTQPPISAVG